jgi:hypothetical protein
VRASVVFSTPAGDRYELGHGDFIGRLWTAGLPVDDARISEAHAMVSLRGGELQLLALRARFSVRGEPLRELTLRAGQRIALAPGFELVVEAVELPEGVLALAMEGLPAAPLASASWLVTTPQPRLLGRPTDGAAAAFWFTGGGWRGRIGDGEPFSLEPGQRLDVGGRAVDVVLHARSAAGGAKTRLGGVGAPLKLVCHYDTVVVERQGVTATTIAGQGARILSELVEIGGPVEWEPLARQLWPDEPDANVLRRRWDTVLGRMRRKLRSRSIRPDLVRADGAGRALLHLEDGDVAELA